MSVILLLNKYNDQFYTVNKQFSSYLALEEQNNFFFWKQQILFS